MELDTARLEPASSLLRALEALPSAALSSWALSNVGRLAL
jgi:hypothetical protein